MEHKAARDIPIMIILYSRMQFQLFNMPQRQKFPSQCYHKAIGMYGHVKLIRAPSMMMQALFRLRYALFDDDTGMTSALTLMVISHTV